MAGLNEEARIPVYINDEQAKSALKNLTAEAEKWRKAMYQAMASGDLKGMKEAETQLKKTSRSMADLKKSAFDVDAVMKNISSASARDLRKALQAIDKEMDGINRNTKEYQALANKKLKLKDELGEINNQLRDQGGIIGKLKNAAGELLPAFGWGAIAAGAVVAFNKIVNASDTLSTKWAVFTGGLKEATNEFWRTLGSGDWSNFLSNMNEAVRVGRQYQEVLDELESRQRGLSLAEADSRQKILDLEDKAKNVTLSNKDRRAAAEERIAIEEELAKKRTSIAQQTFENEVSITMQSSKLSKDRVMQIIADTDSEARAKAEALNKLRDELSSLEKAASRSTTVAMPGSAYVRPVQGNEARQEEIQAMIAAVDGDIKQYADDLIKMGNVTDDQLNKLVEAYGKVKEAETSGMENTKKVRATMYSLIKGEAAEQEKEKKEQIKVTEDANKKELDSLKKQAEAEMEIKRLLWEAGKELEAAKISNIQDATEKEKALWNAEKASLAERLIVKEDLSAQEMELNNKIFALIEEQELQHQNKLNEITKSGVDDKRLMELQDLAVTARTYRERIDAKLALAKEEYDREFAAAQGNREKQLQAEQNYHEKVISIKEDQFKTLQIISEGLLQVTSEIFTGQLEEYETAGQAIVLAALGILKQLVPIWVAQITGFSMASAESVATFGIAGAAKAAALTAVLYGAIGAAEASVHKNIQRKQDAAEAAKKGKKAGGYADTGSDNDIAGFYHANEFIASASAVRNPTIKPVLDIIDIAQRTGRIANLNLPAALGGTGRKEGGYSGSGSSSASSSSTTNNYYHGDPELKALLNKLSNQIDKGIKAKMFYRDFEEYEKEVDDIRDAANL